MIDEGFIEYRDIPGCVGYRAGSDGSIWSCHRQGKNGTCAGVWHKLNPVVTKAGYLQVAIRYAGKTSTRNVHSLVLETFVGPCPDGCMARHFPSNDRANCAITNLCWGTAQQNADDRQRSGTTACGTRNANAKLTEADVLAIRLAGNHRGATAELSRQYGVSRTIIWQIRRRKIWKHL